MKKLLVTFMLATSALTMVVGDADAARRLGGGGSFGRQSQNVPRQAPAQPQPSQPTQSQSANQARPAPAPATAPRPASPWRSMLGGALLGLGLGALLSHFGIGGAFASVISTLLMIALLAFAFVFVMRLFRGGRREEARPAYPGYARTDTASFDAPEIGSRLEPQLRESAALGNEARGGDAAVSRPWGVPADMDVQSFLRNAKTYFIRLQAAWDRGDASDLREFTTPEMLAELKLQLMERGPSSSHTDVVSLNAELLGVETVAGEYLASVKFSGLIKEAENAPAEPFSEVWNLIKPVSGSGGWVLAGIQQLSQA